MSERPVLHPIVAALQPSTEQIPAITTRGRDVVVMAGARRGKTLTLVARYLALLAEGCPLRGAIAMTFTEKAAREMRNRVREDVRRYLEAEDLDGGEHDRWQAIYSGLDAARISTIHGLCAEILRSHPAEARVDPRFDVLSEGQGNLLRRQAIDETLAWAAEDPELVPLFGLLGERGFRSALDALARGRLDASEAFARLLDRQGASSADVLAHWRAELAARQAAALAGLLDCPDWQDAAATVRSEAATKAEDLLEIQRQMALAALREVETAHDLDTRLAVLARLETINLRGGSARSWPGGKEEFEAVKAALTTLRECWKGAELLHLSCTPLDEALAAAMPGLRACFRFAHDRYSALKAVRRALDFDDLEAGALALLETNPAVQARWQAETASLLVDEFQDTNDRQRRLVRRLAGRLGEDSGKLFIVGDAKQSIYRFRGADVTVFREGARHHCARWRSRRVSGHFLSRTSGVGGMPERPPAAGAGRSGRPGAAVGRAICTAAPPSGGGRSRLHSAPRRAAPGAGQQG